MQLIIKIRNLVIGLAYRQIVKRILFLQDPEQVHNRFIKLGEFLGRSRLTRDLTGLLFGYKNKILEQEILGLRFLNPVGLAAGFDKNARLTNIWPKVGFGFAEVGSVTGEPCAGNAGKRLYRLPSVKALVVNYGLLNDGCEKISEQLKIKTQQHGTGHGFELPVGISLAKTNDKKTIDTKAGIKDYVKAYKTFNDQNIGSYYTINISCPNAYGGEPFTEPTKLRLLLAKINEQPRRKPIFIKLPPDLKFAVVDEIIEISRQFKIEGFIASNLTKDRENLKIKATEVPAKGGISGKAVEPLADELIKYLYQKTKGEFVIVGCGGVFCAKDAYKKIRLGANLVQLITGMIYQGPQVISEINQGLAKLLKRDGFKNISQAVGLDNS